MTRGKHTDWCRSVHAGILCNCPAGTISDTVERDKEIEVDRARDATARMPTFIVLPGEGSEADRAAKAKAEIQEALRGVCTAIDAAAAAGFVTSFQLGLGPTGRQIVAHLSLAKHF